jgi:NADPH2:quinone reductase
MPDTMNAWVIDDFGGPEAFHRTTRPVPEPGPGEVVIRVAATSVNPIDYKVRSGAAAHVAPPRPAVLHGDVAGIVEAVGEEVGALAPGDRVFGCAGGFKNAPEGALADLMRADADLLAAAPETLSLPEAAALPLVALTAWEALMWKADVREGEKVLVHGATGGVGHVGLQLARWPDAETYVTASTDAKLDVGQDLGATGTINYTEEAVADYVERCTGGRGFDVVFDTVGGDNVDRAIEAAALNGRVVSIAAREPHDIGPAYQRGVSLLNVMMLIPMVHGVGRARHGQILGQVAKLVDEGRLQPLVDERDFTFDEVGEAHAYAESGAQVGKVVVTHPDADSIG